MSQEKEETNLQGSMAWGCEPAGLTPINPWEINKLHITYAASAYQRGCGQTQPKVGSLETVLCCSPDIDPAGSCCARPGRAVSYLCEALGRVRDQQAS